MKKNIEQLVVAVFDEYSDDDNISYDLQIPQDIKNGHLSSNYALKNAKIFQTNPREIAEKLREQLENIDGVSKVEVAGPGFINIYYETDSFKDIVLEIKNNELIKEKVKDEHKYNVEYVSANPTGDLHLGHARNAIYSDALTRIMKKSGYDITREYYVNDAGQQMINLGLSVKYFYLEAVGVKSEFPEDGYRGAEIKKIGTDLAEEFGKSLVDKDVEFFKHHAFEINMQEIKNILKELRVEFDVFSSEQYYHDSGKVKKSVDILKDKGNVYEEEGAVWLETSKYGDEKDRVIQKANNTHTYLTSDIAYHIDKFDRGYDKLIDIWGGDHHGYVDRVKASISALGHNQEDFEVRLIQMVSILRNNEVVKMSKRKGTSVTIKELVNEVPVDAIRYFFVMRSPDTQLDFDIELTKKNTSENPVYYIQYAHARICSILKTAKEKEIKVTDEITNISSSANELILHLSKYNSIVLESANKRLPHIVANYLYDLATLYHQYYNKEKVFVEDINEVNDKLNIQIAVKNVLADGLELLAVEAKEEM